MSERVALVLALGACAACGPGAERMVAVDGHRFVPGIVVSPEPGWDESELEDDASRTEALRQDFERRLRASHASGGLLVVTKDGEVLVEEGFGEISPGGEAVTNETLFLLASVSKVFLALSALSAAEQGSWDLDAPLGDLVSGVDPRITPRLALSHQAGVPDTSACDLELETPTDWAEAHAADPLWSPPGALFNYSNAGFTLAGAALEALSAQRLPAVVEQLVFAPAGAALATYELSGGAPARAVGQDTSLTPAEHFACGLYEAAGGAWGSARDLSALLLGLLGETAAFSSSLRAELTAPQVSIGNGGRADYGHGVFVERYGQELVAYHLGGVPGFGAGLLFMPGRRFGIAYAANSADFVPLLHDAVALYFGPELERTPLAPDLGDIDAYAGTWVDPTGLLGQLRIEAAGSEITLVPLGEHAVWPLPIDGTFWPGADGQVRYFATRLGVAVKQEGGGEGGTGP